MQPPSPIYTYKVANPSIKSKTTRSISIITSTMTITTTTTIVFLISLLAFSPSSDALNQDFCVADLTMPSTPVGFPCKNPSSATADDFVFNGTRSAGSTMPRFNAAVNPAFVNQFPGLNGLGLSAVRFDIGVGGFVPIHTHPHATEMIFLIKGRLVAGFISATGNVPYYKTLEVGDLMVFPRGSLHFQINTGRTPAFGLATFNDENPGVAITSLELFNNTLPSAIVEKVTLLDHDVVKKIRASFGGSG